MGPVFSMQEQGSNIRVLINMPHLPGRNMHTETVCHCCWLPGPPVQDMHDVQDVS